MEQSSSRKIGRVSYLLRGTAANDTLRVLAMDTTSLVEEARARHQTSPTATAALGRSLTAALLLAQTLSKRPEDRVTLRIQGTGPIGYIVAEGGRDGTARGYVKHPEADLPPRGTDGKLDVGALVGADGELSVTRLLENLEPYTGSVPLVSGEIAEDVATYLASSEQLPSAVLLGVLVGAEGVTQAGGLLVQTIPGVSEETLATLEENIRAMGQLTTVMRAEGIPGVLERALRGLEFVAHGEAEDLRFKCRCSLERAINAMTFFGDAEREEMAVAGGQEVVCHWCGERYIVTPDLLRALNENPASAN
jgi:molecular chaperone Hsp33